MLYEYFSCLLNSGIIGLLLFSFVLMMLLFSFISTCRKRKKLAKFSCLIGWGAVLAFLIFQCISIFGKSGSNFSPCSYYGLCFIVAIESSFAVISMACTFTVLCLAFSLKNDSHIVWLYSIVIILLLGLICTLEIFRFNARGLLRNGSCDDAKVSRI